MHAAVEQVQTPLFRRHTRRPRLTRLLDESRAQAIVVTAPAGYGKTTLVMEWLQGGGDAVWYRATNASADLAAFSAGLADVMTPFVPGAGDRLKQRLRVADTPERAARPLAELLAEDIASWPTDALLVIDDYHLVADSAPVEEFFDWLLTLAPQLRVLVTSRRVPRWASARRILYGEITEIGREQLAMTADEARRLLSDRPPDSVRALVSQAEGWPALIGLAALTASHEIPAERVSEALYRYFADEVVRAEAKDVERFMLLASVPNVVDVRIAKEVLEIEEPQRIIETLVTDGLLHRAEGQHRFHPLLRGFLRRRFQAEEPESYRKLLLCTAVDSRRFHRWDEAFSLAQEANETSLQIGVLQDAADDLLCSGRIETLERWLDACASDALDHPGAAIIRAEVLIRQGRFAEASSIAEDVGARLSRTDDLAARAANVSGLSRYLSSDVERARSYYERANDLARLTEDKKDALWGAFISTVDDDIDLAQRYLDALEELSADLNVRLRVATGRQVVGSHSGTLRGIWALISPMVAVAPHASDPVVKSNFIAQAGYVALARTDYLTSIQLSTEALEMSQALGHDFAIASCLAYRAASEIGCRELEAARKDLREMSLVRATLEDPYLQTEYALMQVRLALAEGNLVRAQMFVEAASRGTPDRATRGERLGISSIVLAALGECARSAAAADQAMEVTRSVEAQYYSRFGRFIAGTVSAKESSASHLGQLVSDAAADGFLEAFVVAYRAHPMLLRLAASQDADLVGALIERTHDQALARRTGADIGVSTSEAQTSLLTPREEEVLALLGQGLSNAEIAKRLFITKSTAKVHVHNVLRKLGVRTRLQAAMVAKTRDS